MWVGVISTNKFIAASALLGFVDLLLFRLCRNFVQVCGDHGHCGTPGLNLFFGMVVLLPISAAAGLFWWSGYRLRRPFLHPLRAFFLRLPLVFMVGFNSALWGLHFYLRGYH